jgi:hypothetical protein
MYALRVAVFHGLECERQSREQGCERAAASQGISDSCKSHFFNFITTIWIHAVGCAPQLTRQGGEPDQAKDKK